MRVLVVLLLLWQSNLYSQLVINEIMAAPQDGGPEWVELYSNSDSEIVITDWTISDKVKTSAIPNLIIEPNTFIVLTKNKTDFLNLWDVNSDLVYELDLPILNNTTDDVVIKDANGAIVDSVYYSTKWGETGKSLERIAVNDPSNESSNWAAPLQNLLGTPGELNTHSVAKIIQNVNLGDLLINEIMFDTDDNCGEFLELYNSSDTTIFLKDFVIHDAVGSFEKGLKIEGEVIILPKSYLAITWEENFFNSFSELQESELVYYQKNSLALNKTGDYIAVLDDKGNLIDSITYSEKWHNQNLISTTNISLEKIDLSAPSHLASSWSSSGDSKGATPGKANSLQQDISIKGKIVATPNPFSPYSSGSDAYCTISYDLPFSQALIKVKIFDLNGIEITELENNQYTSGQGSIIWDGKNKSGNNLPIGAYIAALEAVDLNTDKTFYEKIIIAIGK